MAVYDGVPSIRLEGDQKRALALLPEAKALLYKVQTFKQLAGVPTFSMSQRVDDDSLIYVLSAGDVHIIRISVAVDVPEQPTVEATSGEGALFPDFYSGLVFGGFIESRTGTLPGGGRIDYSVCTKFAPTIACRSIDEDLVLGRQDSVRLAVRPHTSLEQVLGNPRPPPVLSQYTRLRSSMYSGTMKKVVQVVMGLGRLSKAKLRNPRATVPDSQYIKDVEANGVQVRYDWRFSRTHGITVGADGRLWLVEISQTRGVLARPLPVFPNSMTLAFRARAENRGDTAMVTVLDELGCLPTGEGFPVTAAQLDALVANGDVLRLLEPAQLEEFYKCSAYSSGMGWAFSSMGNEAHNTGYYFDDTGFQRGVWYQISISIGAVRQNRGPGDPIGTGSATLRKQREGYLYAPPATSPISWLPYLPIKFHEPLLGGLLSHVGVPAIRARALPPPLVDTPMFVSFVDDDLKVVSYYRNPKREPNEGVDDPRFPGECLYAGAWAITETWGDRALPHMMYSNDFDDRRVMQEHIRITTIQSEDLGFDPPRFSDYIFAPEAAFVFREKFFRRTTTVDDRREEFVVSAVAVPEFSREAYYYATNTGYVGNRTGSTGVAFDSLTDPNGGLTWRCFPRINEFPYPPGTDKRQCAPNIRCPGAISERRVVVLTYSPGGCSDFADAGQWLQLCDAVDSFNSPGPRRISSFTNWNLGTDQRATLQLITPGYGGPLTIPVTPSQVMNHWMRPSPDPESGELQFIEATHSAIGSDALIYADGLSSYGNEFKTYGFLHVAIAPNEIPAFIGVNGP